MADEKTDIRFLMQLDDICDEYESHFTSGEAPDVESYLQRVAAEHRTTLLVELAGLEARLRAERGEEVSADDLVNRYEALLPDSENLSDTLRSTIENALASTDQAAGQTITFTPQGGPTWAEDPLPQIEGYRIESILGKGGMGIVYKAVVTLLDRPVALKMIRTTDPDDREYVERFVREAKAVSELDDPHIVKIHRFGESEGRPFMELELVEGGSLEDARRGEPQPIEFAADILEQLSRGMATAHKAGLVHRDLKPHNVLLGSDGTPKITDFGLVKRQDQETQMTEQGRVMGTASYMAPEQTWGSDEVTASVDIYALGGILYCLLTGRPPFLAATHYDTILQVRNEDPIPPSRLRPGIPKDLETICLKCLQKDSTKRYSTSAELADDLRRFEEDRPILARPVSQFEKVWRWARRNPKVAGLSTSVAALVLTIAVVSTSAWLIVSDKNVEITTAWGKEKIARQESTSAWLIVSDKNVEITTAWGKEKIARQDAEHARDVAREQRNFSLDIVRNVLIRIDNSLRDTPRMFQVRQEVLTKALEDLDKVRVHAADNPLEDRAEAAAWQRLGDIYLRCNRTEDAERLYDRAYNILKTMASVEPINAVNSRNLAAITAARGDVHLRRGEANQARECYQQALELRGQWVHLLQADATAGPRPRAEAQESVADSHALVGKANLYLGDPAAALASYEAAREQYDTLPKQFRNRVPIRRELAALQQRLGDANYQLRHVPLAEEHYRTALLERQRLYQLAKKAGREDDLVTLARDICLSWLSLGDFYFREHKDLAKAWENYRSALEVLKDIRKEDPDLAQARTDMAAIHYRVGATLLAANKSGETLEGAEGTPDEHFEESRKLREELFKIDESDTQAKLELSLALARCGKAVEAEELADQLRDHGKNEPRLLFQAACTYALCTDNDDAEVAERCRNKSLEVLRESVDVGWKDVNALLNDPDLDPIRTDARFEDIIEVFPKTDT